MKIVLKNAEFKDLIYVLLCTLDNLKHQNYKQKYQDFMKKIPVKDQIQNAQTIILILIPTVESVK